MLEAVEFRTGDGVVLRGELCASATGRAPAIVMAHGFSGVKEQISPYATAFARAGYAVLSYDHRSFGASDGLPRREVHAGRQIDDWRDAITYMLERPEVDPAPGVGVWGSSFGGGVAMVLGALDPRVGCVVAQIPHVSGQRNGGRIFDVAALARLEQLFDADRRARAAGAEPLRTPVMTAVPGEVCALPPAVSPRYIAAAEAQAPTWVNDVTLRSIEAMLAFEPAAWIKYIAPTPLMMIVGRRDTLTLPNLQLQVFAEASEPKRLLIHPGGHFDTYADHFDATSRGALAWFDEHLRSAPAADIPIAPRSSAHADV